MPNKVNFLLPLIFFSLLCGARELTDMSLEIVSSKQGNEAKQEAFDRATEEATHRLTEVGVVLQKNGGFLGQVVPLFKKLGASRLGDGRQWMPWIHMDDMLKILVQALEDTRMSGVINAVAPQPVTNKEVTHDLGKAVGAWSGPPAPGFALKLMYGELAEALLFSQRAVPAKLQQLGFEFKYPEFKLAIEQALK